MCVVDCLLKPTLLPIYFSASVCVYVRIGCRVPAPKFHAVDLVVSLLPLRVQEQALERTRIMERFFIIFPQIKENGGETEREKKIHDHT